MVWNVIASKMFDNLAQCDAYIIAYIADALYLY